MTRCEGFGRVCEANDPARSRKATQSTRCGVAAGMVLLCGCAACETTSAWRGSGLLHPSGEPTVSATYVVRAASCSASVSTEESADDSTFGGPARVEAEENASGRPDPRSFSVLAIGDRCAIDGSEGTVCTLAFQEGARTLRVTDVVFHYGTSGRHVDRRLVEVRVGGADIATGRHVVFEFLGQAAEEGPAPDLCEQALAKSRTKQAAQSSPNPIESGDGNGLPGRANR